MAQYIQGPGGKVYPTYTGKSKALVAAQMSQGIARNEPIRIATPTSYSTPAVTYAAATPATETVGTTGGATETYAPTYSTPAIPEIDLNAIWELAGQYADAEINPQLAEIDRLLQQAGYDAGESARAINEAYPVARRSLQKSIYENMVAGEQGLAAMGTGRGGGRQELLARAGEREAAGIESIETQKQRELGAIQRALESYKGQLGTKRTSLVGQRGALQSTYAEQIRGNRFNEAATRANLALQNAQLAEQQRQFNEQMAQMSQPAQTYVQGATGQSYNTENIPYFLTAEDLAALGLTPTGTAKTTGTKGNYAVGTVYTPTGAYATGGLRKSSSSRPYTTNPAIARW